MRPPDDRVPPLHRRRRTPGGWFRPAFLACALASIAPAAAGDDTAPATTETPMMISEAKLPEGFPPPGPVGTAVVKTYPAHRLARTMAARDGDDRMFMKLFRHIERHDIAMTAPVTMAWSDAAATPARAESMAFLYARPDIGAAGADPADSDVVVEDVPEITVVSVGVRGTYGAATVRKGMTTLEAWLAAHPEWSAAGPPRMLAYNSPFVPWFLKFAEVQVPLTRRPPAGR